MIKFPKAVISVTKKRVFFLPAESHNFPIIGLPIKTAVGYEARDNPKRIALVSKVVSSEKKLYSGFKNNGVRMGISMVLLMKLLVKIKINILYNFLVNFISLLNTP